MNKLAPRLPIKKNQDCQQRKPGIDYSSFLVKENANIY